MKRILYITLSIVMTLSFSACSLGKDHVLITGFGDGGNYESDRTVEYYLLNEIKQVGKKSRTYDVEIGGTVYTGNYVETVISPYYKCDADVFEYSDNNGFHVYFWINRSSKELVMYTLGYLRGFEVLSDTETKTYDECYQIALDELGSRLNIEDYYPYKTEDSLKPFHDADSGDVYEFLFIKKVNSVDTNIIISFSISANGAYRSYSAGLSPSIDCSKDHSAAIEAYYSERSLELLDEKIRSIYSDQDQDKLTWDISSKYISKLRSGRECVQFEIRVYPEGDTKKDSLLLLLPV